MKTFSRVDLPNWAQVRQDIEEVIFSNPIPDSRPLYYLDDWHLDQEDRFRNIDSLKCAMQTLGWLQHWKCTAILMIYQDGLGVHRDTGDCDYSLVLPIHNTEMTHTVFYHSDSEPVMKSIKNSPVTYWGYDLDQVDEIDRVEMIQPTLINVKTLHGVSVQNPNVPRVTVALRLNQI